MPELGAYSREIVLARPDMRSKEGRLLKQVRTELTRQLGGRLTPAQVAMVERCAMLQLRCAVLDGKLLNGTFSEYDGKTYLAFSNSLARALKMLGLKATAAKGPSLAEVLREAREAAA
jgi:hypothetical protein